MRKFAQAGPVPGSTVMTMRSMLLIAVAGCSGISSDPSDGELVVDQQTQPTYLALGGADVYFTSADSSDYRVLRAPKDGGAAEVLGSAGVIFAIVADDTGVYWVESNAGIGRVMGRPRTASAAVELGVNPNTFNGYTLRNLAADAQAVYYADLTGAVWKTPKAGGGSVELGKTDTSAGSIALSADTIWVATLHGAKVFPKAGGAATELAFSQQLPDDLVWDAGTLFAAFGGTGAEDGEILRVPMTGVPITLAEGLVLPGSLVSADGSLYVTTGNADASIRRVPHTGGSATALASGRRPADVAVDEDFVYWTDPPLGEIRRVAR